MVDQTLTTFFNKIYDDTYQKTLCYVASRCQSTHEIPDIVQEIYTEVYSAIIKKGSAYLKNSEAFVMQIAKTKLYRHHSFAQRMKGLIPLFVRNDEGEEFPVPDLITEDFSVEDAAVNSQLLCEIWGIVTAKPQDVQRIFTLYYLGELTIREIAKELRCSESQVKNKLYRTVNEIRAIYKRGDDSHE